MGVKVSMSVSAAVKVLPDEEFRRLFGSGGKPRAPKSEKVQFVTHPELPEGRGHTVCARCLAFHGVISLRRDMTRPIPPLHPNCYCEERPVIDARLRSDGGEASDDKSAALPAMRPGEFLARRVAAMTQGEAEKTFGVGIGKLLKAEVVSIDQVISKARGLKTLEEVAGSLGLTAKQVLSLSAKEIRALLAGRAA